MERPRSRAKPNAKRKRAPTHSSNSGRALPVVQRPSRYGRWRAMTLAGVYILMGLHIAHWKMAGKTLAPLELNEVMYTLELGIVTAGFLFMAAACLATLIFGRFFCSWGCHILALQDLCSWILRKLRIRPKPVRSRMLLVVPIVAMLYMFAWPQVTRLIEGGPLPEIHVRTDQGGWGSFTTTDFWRNLPGPGIALLTFAICGFAIIYVLGSRAFCTYGCPYGAIFRGLDRFAPGRIVAAGDCTQCGACTAACPSGVIVHEELAKFGTVVSAACVKDLECVSACPNNAVRYGLGRPPLLRGPGAWRALRRPFDFTPGEDALMAIVFIATLLSFRGLYDAVPFLMTLGLAAIVSYLTVVALRLVRRRDVRMSHLLLKRAGRLTGPGAGFVVIAVAFLAFGGHSAFIRYHEFFGYRAADRVTRSQAAADSPVFARALQHLETCRAWGLLTPPKLAQQLGRLRAVRGEFLAHRGDFDAAAAELLASIRLRPDVAAVHYNYGVVMAAMGRPAEAQAAYEWAAALDATDADVQNNLGFLLAQQRRWADAQRCFETALRHQPRHADAHFNLARVLSRAGRSNEASVHFRAAADLDPRYAELLQTGRRKPDRSP